GHCTLAGNDDQGAPSSNLEVHDVLDLLPGEERWLDIAQNEHLMVEKLLLLPRKARGEAPVRRRRDEKILELDVLVPRPRGSEVALFPPRGAIKEKHARFFAQDLQPKVSSVVEGCDFPLLLGKRKRELLPSGSARG